MEDADLLAVLVEIDLGPDERRLFSVCHCRPFVRSAPGRGPDPVQPSLACRRKPDVANQTVRNRRRKLHGTFAGRGAFIAETWGSGVVLQHLVLSATMRPNFG